MHPGQSVIVTDYAGKSLKRKVVDVIEGIVLICMEDEYETAKVRRCLPWCVGFKAEAIREERKGA